MKELKPILVREFVRPPAPGGSASAFAAEFRNLAIPNVAATGHRFRLFGQDPTAVRIEEARRGGPVPEKINFSVDYLPANFLALGAERSRAVALIETDGVDFAGNTGRWSGTGFLVADTLLLTNYHVLNSVDVAKNARVIFNYQLDVNQKPAETVAFKLDPERLFVVSPLHGGLDYCFVWIDAAAARQFGTIPLLRSAFTVQVGDRANIIQHPRGGRKQVVLQENEVLRDSGLVLHYASDTDIGSSGSPVFDNRWHLIALHHAADRNRDGLKLSDDRPAPTYLNEGIKISAIAADLERRAVTGQEGDGPATVLAAFRGIDSLMGYFGGLGRQPAAAVERARQATPLQQVVEIYSAENRDLDVAFWNVEWFTERSDDLVPRMAVLLADFNLDIWVLAEMTARAAEALTERMQADLGLTFGWATAAGIAAPVDERTTAVLWNKATVEAESLAWPDAVTAWFGVSTQQFDALRRATVPGPLFDGVPGLFRFSVCNRSADGLAPVSLHLVALQSRRNAGGRQRQRMACRVFAAAVAATWPEGGESDWLIGGAFDPASATHDLAQALAGAAATLSAATADGAQAISCLRCAGSLIERILLSPNLSQTYGADDLFVVAASQRFPDYLAALAPAPPVLVRLSFADQPTPAAPPPPSLIAALASA
jgi:V8-like Glu-specific endopeptidase